MSKEKTASDATLRWVRRVIEFTLEEIRREIQNSNGYGIIEKDEIDHLLKRVKRRLLENTKGK